MRSTTISRTRRALGLSFGGAAALSMLAFGFGAQADQLPVHDTVCHEDRKPAVVYFATHAIPHPFWSIVIKGAEEGARGRVPRDEVDPGRRVLADDDRRTPGDGDCRRSRRSRHHRRRAENAAADHPAGA